MRRPFLAFILGLASAPFSRGADDAASALFQTNVWPLLENSCLRCHGPEKQKGDLRLDSREAALKGGKDGPSLVPGRPADSLMIKLVRHTDPDREMPPKDKLHDDDIASMEKWIAGGAPWPAVIASKSAVPKEKLGDAWNDPRNPIVKIFAGKRLDLWSLKPIADPAPPAVQDAKWVSTPVDAFILAKLEGAGAKPAPEADRRTLARRLYFDLTGLPPTPEEMSAFLADSSPDACKNLADKLLDSPRYGEQWARMWLDVARYSDSNGFDWDEFRPEAWRYRDYVIRSFNADKPFNLFVREQLAGDEMVPGAPRTREDQDRLIATGFLRVGPYDNSASKFGEDNRCRTQVMSDLVETTGSAFLGLTLSCSRCHNHKFDPISQDDYYRLRAFFEGVESVDYVPIDLEKDQEAISRNNTNLDRRITDLVKICDDIARPYIENLRAKRLERLSKEDLEFLQNPPANQTPDMAKRLASLKKRTEPRRDQVESYFTKEEKKRYDAADAETDVLLEKGRGYTTALIARDKDDSPPTTRLLFQGDFNQPREPVEPGVLSVFDPNPASVRPPARPNSSGRRTALAEWIASEKNPLTARVLVNRVWQGHFGEPLQATPNDVGYAGARPSNPELLDWLAREFMRQGWSLKNLHRLIVNSSTYRQALPGTTLGEKSSALQAGHEPRRLTAEQLRDAMLAVSGSLLPCEGGPPLWPVLPDEVLRSTPSLFDDEFPLKMWHASPPEKTNVRSVYLVQKRNVRVPMMETFDLPDNTLSCPRRNISTVAPQALALLNDPFSVEMSKSFAKRLQREAGSDPAAQIDRAFALAFQRQPDDAERASCRSFLEQHGLDELCRAILNLNEFAYVD